MAKLIPTFKSPDSKYAQVETVLLDEIRARRFGPGDRIWSEPTLARNLGVSRSTVRHAIENLVQRGVLESRSGFGHVVRSQQPRLTVGVIFYHTQFLPQIAPFHNGLLWAMREQVHQRQARTLLYFTPDGELDFDKLAADIKRRRFHALIGRGWPRDGEVSRRHRAQDSALLKDLEAQRIPFVELGTRQAPNAVTTDHHAISRLPTELMLKHQVRRIALVSTAMPQLADGFRDAMLSAGIRIDLPLDTSNEHACWLKGYTERQCYEQFLAWWDQGHRPSALVITDDVQAKGVMTALLHRGVRVPQDLRLASLMIRGSELFYPQPLISVELDPVEFAGKAIDAVFCRLQSPRADIDPITIAPRLICPPGYLGPA